MKNIPNEAITHAGRFHADDVFSAALLKILNPNIVIRRENKIPDKFEGLVFDLTGGEFDHHGEKSMMRENGIPYASFGLLWKQYGGLLVDEEAAKLFDEVFVQPLDIQDNQGGNNLLARVITQANPRWDSEAKPDECFFEIMQFAEFILKNEIESMKSINKAKQIVIKALEAQQNGVVVLKVGVPWKSVLIPEEVYYVVYPSARGGYNAQAVPIALGSQICKIPFPEQWRGKRDVELRELTGIKSLNFCHPGGYLLNTEKLEDAINACEKSMKMEYYK